MDEQARYHEAKQLVEEIKGFYFHFISYIVVNAVLVVIILLTSPEYFWLIWPIIGWGVGLVIHAFSVFSNLLGKKWEESKIKERKMIYSKIPSRIVFISLAYLLLLSNPCLGQIECPGSYGGHLQGITTDNAKTIYWSFTTDLVKTDAKGKLLIKITVPNHHGDLTYHDGRIYVAVNLGEFNKEKGHAKSWVYVYDAEKLNLVSRHSTPEVIHGAGGIDYHNNNFYVVGGLPKGHTENYIYEYDKDFKFLKKHTINSGYTLMGIQTAFYMQGCWWFGCYGNSQNLLKTDDSFKLLGKYNFDCAMGICRFSDDKFLIGRKLSSQNQRGQAFVATIDQTKGLAIVEKKSNNGVEPTR
ncbi:2TM domain-containing protein [Bacteroidota bacterium]